MRMNRTNILYICFVGVLLLACNDNIPVTDLSEIKNKTPYKENMLNATNYVAKSEENEIDNYIKRRGWDDMKRMDNGLRIWEYDKGSGKPVEYNKMAVVSYSVESITGKMIYENEVDTIVVGKNEPNIGVDKALQMLNYGSRARLILPSHLGYGVMGDGDRIGHNLVLVYDLKVENK